MARLRDLVISVVILLAIPGSFDNGYGQTKEEPAPKSPTYRRILPSEEEAPKIIRPQAPPNRNWPGWSGIAGRPPSKISQSTSELPEVYQEASSSVYLVIATSHPGKKVVKGETKFGSGVAVSEQELLTNCHILTEATGIFVLHQDKLFESTITRADAGSDRCVIRTRNLKLKPVAGLRPYDELAVGERVLSIGSPRGLEKTLGEGIISGLREWEGIKLIQTTAPISPGSSGGGLFDVQGNLIGITTFLLLQSQSLNFAIAADEYWR